MPNKGFGIRMCNICLIQIHSSSQTHFRNVAAAFSLNMQLAQITQRNRQIAFVLEIKVGYLNEQKK